MFFSSFENKKIKSEIFSFLLPNQILLKVLIKECIKLYNSRLIGGKEIFHRNV